MNDLAAASWKRKEISVTDPLKIQEIISKFWNKKANISNVAEGDYIRISNMIVQNFQYTVSLNSTEETVTGVKF